MVGLRGANMDSSDWQADTVKMNLVEASDRPGDFAALHTAHRAAALAVGIHSTATAQRPQPPAPLLQRLHCVDQMTQAVRVWECRRAVAHDTCRRSRAAARRTGCRSRTTPTPSSASGSGALSASPRASRSCWVSAAHAPSPRDARRAGGNASLTVCATPATHRASARRGARHPAAAQRRHSPLRRPLPERLRAASAAAR